MENAIREGIIYWHAFPYNGQLEFMDERHVRENVQLTHDLDAKFGYKPKITLSQVHSHRIELSSTHVFHVADGRWLWPKSSGERPFSSCDVVLCMHAEGYANHNEQCHSYPDRRERASKGALHSA